MDKTSLIIIIVLAGIVSTFSVKSIYKKEPVKTYTHSVYYNWEKGQQYTAVLFLDSELEAFEHGEYKHVKELYIEGGRPVQTFKFNKLDLDIDSYMIEIYKNDNLIVMEKGIFD